MSIIFKFLYKVKYIFPRLINRLFFNFYKIFPIKKNLIIMESNDDFTDNTQALYQYMQKNGYLKKYKVVWLADNPNELRRKEDVFAIYKRKDKLNLALDFYMATCKYYIYSHSNEFSVKGYSSRKNQVVFNLWHGVPYKNNKVGNLNFLRVNYDNFLSTGKYCTKTLAKFLNAPEKIAVELGYPRLDYFFSDLTEVRQKFEKKFKFSLYNKIILWMPTFRKSNLKNISEDYMQNKTGLPIFETKNQLFEFNKFLEYKNILFVLKIHPLQADLPIFQTKFSNIIILKNEDLQDMNVQPYQFIPITDALISDYSSVAIDYIVLDKPLVYTLDDYADYAKSRGFIVDNVLDYMPGYHVYNVEDMEKSISEIAEGKDVYKEQRNKLLPVMHKYPNGGASKRILDYLDIKV